MRQGRNYNGYNFREYIQRRVREEFIQNKGVSDPEAIAKLHANARTNLKIIERQTAISRMYNRDKLVIEY